jgi:hypothetical protein
MSDRTLSDQGHENLSSLFKKDLPRLFLISIDTNSIKLVSKETYYFGGSPRQTRARPLYEVRKSAPPLCTPRGHGVGLV